MEDSWREDHPDRPVDWRWRRAQLAFQKRVGRGDDGWVRKMVRFPRGYERCRTRGATYAVIDKYPGLFWAYDIAVLSPPDNCVRTVIESRLLAREDRDRIA